MVPIRWLFGVLIDEVDSETMKLFSEDELRQDVQDLIGVFDGLIDDDDDDDAEDSSRSPSNSSSGAGTGTVQEDLDDVFLRIRRSVHTMWKRGEVNERLIGLQALELQAIRGDCPDSSLAEQTGMFKTTLELDDTVEVEKESPLWKGWCELTGTKKPDAMRLYISKFNGMEGEGQAKAEAAIEAAEFVA